MKQVIRNDGLMWDTAVPNGNLSEIEILLLLIRRIRNNLFHGGKHNLDVFEDTQRTTILLQSALVIIEECVSLEPRVKAAYDQARI